MPKIPDFSKFDLQNIVSSIKTIINSESGTPDITEGDPIGAKIVQISTLLQNTANAQAQSAKDLTKINDLLNLLYKDLESFRKIEAELRQNQHAQTESSSASSTEEPIRKAPTREEVEEIEKDLKNEDKSPNEGTSAPTTRE